MAEAPIDPVETLLVAETPEECPCYEGTPFLGNYQPPRLGIIHLLAWVTVAAILLKNDLALGVYDIHLPNKRELIHIPANACYSIFSAAILVGGATLLIDRCWRKPGRLQPGHWILAFQAFFIVVAIPMGSISFFFLGDSQYNGICSWLFHIGMNFFLMLAFFWGCISLLEPRRWKCGLAFIGLNSLLTVFSTLASWVCTNTSSVRTYHSIGNELIRVGVAALLFVIMIIDIKERCRRDWLHWLGAIYPVFIVVLGISMAVVYHLFW